MGFAIEIAVYIAAMIAVLFYVDQCPSWSADLRWLWRRMKAIDRKLFPRTPVAGPLFAIDGGQRNQQSKPNCGDSDGRSGGTEALAGAAIPAGSIPELLVAYDSRHFRDRRPKGFAQQHRGTVIAMHQRTNQ